MKKKYQVRCSACGAFETDDSRLCVSKHPLTGYITIAFWCIQCGAECEKEISPKFYDYARFDALYS